MLQEATGKFKKRVKMINLAMQIAKHVSNKSPILKMTNENKRKTFRGQPTRKMESSES
jgi:hypothetical protein